MTPKQVDEMRLARLLAERLQFMGTNLVKLAPGDRPDVTGEHQGTPVGIEVAKAVFNEEMRAAKLHAQGRIGMCSMDKIVDGPVAKTEDQIIVAATSFRGSFWSIHEEIAEAWRTKIKRVINQKRAVLNKPGFVHYQENWLLLQDGPYHFVERLERDDLNPLAAFLSEPHPNKIDFDSIYIVGNNALIRWKDGCLAVAESRA